MKNQAFHEQVIRDVIARMNEENIDLYAIITSEHADLITDFIPGVDTVGNSAYLFCRDGSRYALASKIDKHDVEISGLFPNLIVYEDYETELVKLFRQLAPKVVALNCSETAPECDGLTLGRYERFLAAMGGKLDFTVVPSDCILLPVMRAAGK
ncbi:MAG: hypothetical protein PHY12_00545 [Eubacteriales bacterium]|nr:hypothetical protein [Eubacteriales bacterium]